MSRDADLRRCTQPDAVPVVCKQGVRGSSPLSSTGQDAHDALYTGDLLWHRCVVASVVEGAVAVISHEPCSRPATLAARSWPGMWG
jgi:hypothetical protein